MPAKSYDYIFLGGGCASLSIIMRMITSEKFSQKKILLVDREPKIRNDRTWCFWEQEAGFFEDIVYRKWTHLCFKTDEVSIPLEIGRYQYKMIRGIDFYNKCLSDIKLSGNIDIIHGEISFEEGNGSMRIKINDEILYYNPEAVLFNSLYAPAPREKDKFHLLQHFKGWVVEAGPDSFDAKQATLMDFRVAQTHGTAFVYVLPLSSDKALVEYTFFSENLRPPAEYNIGLKNYLEQFLGVSSYTIVEEEFGVIPMTNANFPFFKNGMFFIGTAGGQTKASTGYTFRFIQKQADAVVSQLISTGSLSKNKILKTRFYFYDSTLLHILSKNLLPGKTIFSILFKKNRADKVLKFLDNETSVAEEIQLLNSLPKRIFIKAGITEFTRMILRRTKS
jgi:lycopene beta-cyclase